MYAVCIYTNEGGLYLYLHTPAVADFYGSPTSGTRRFLLFLQHITGSINSYTWSFGDGNTSTLQPTQCLSDSQGHTRVSLTVIGPGGSDYQNESWLHNGIRTTPVVSFSGSPTSGVTPHTVIFIDWVDWCYFLLAMEFRRCNTSTNSKTSTLLTKNSGAYDCQPLTVTGPGGVWLHMTRVDYITVSEPIPAPSTLALLLQVLYETVYQIQFSDLSSGPITSLGLGFLADGTGSTAQNPTHIYKLCW